MSGAFVSAENDALLWNTNVPNVEAFTAMVWAKRTDAATHTFVSLGEVGVSGRSMFFDGSNNFLIWDGSGTVLVDTSRGPGTWYCCALRGNGTEIKAYIKTDGAPSFVTNTGTQATGIGENLLCLGRWINGGDYHNGSLRAFKQWNVALSDAQIDAESTQLRPIVTSGLQREIRLTNGADSNDSSGNGFNPTSIEGTIGNGADDPTTPEIAGPGAFPHALRDTFRSVRPRHTAPGVAR